MNLYSSTYQAALAGLRPRPSRSAICDRRSRSSFLFYRAGSGVRGRVPSTQYTVFSRKVPSTDNCVPGYSVPPQFTHGLISRSESVSGMIVWGAATGPYLEDKQKQHNHRQPDAGDKQAQELQSALDSLGHGLGSDEAARGPSRSFARAPARRSRAVGNNPQSAEKPPELPDGSRARSCAPFPGSDRSMRRWS